MENDKLIKEENEVTNMNNSNNKNGIIAVLVVIIIALIGVIIYFAFIKKADEPINNNGGNNQQQQNNNQTNENNGQDINKTKISKKMIKMPETCKNVSETFNNIKIEATIDTEYYDCGYRVLVNGHDALDGIFQVMSIEVYDNYVIIDYADTGSSWIKLLDTRDVEKEYTTSVEGYYFPEYISDDEGLLITAHYTEMFEGPNPGSKHAKIRIKYENGYFGSPEIVEKYN